MGEDDDEQTSKIKFRRRKLENLLETSTNSLKSCRHGQTITLT